MSAQNNSKQDRKPFTFNNYILNQSDIQ